MRFARGFSSEKEQAFLIRVIPARVGIQRLPSARTSLVSGFRRNDAACGG